MTISLNASAEKQDPGMKRSLPDQDMVDLSRMIRNKSPKNIIRFNERYDQRQSLRMITAPLHLASVGGCLK